MAKDKPAVGEKAIPAKVKHENIVSALAGFHSKNPSITKSKEFGKEGEKMHWWYAPLDELLETVRPLTSQQGLAFTWEESAKGDGLVCALYHETYKSEESKVKDEFKVDGTLAETTYGRFETGVFRSMPIKVKREGDMKQIGADSTYARRYTLAEVLGIAPDEDKDAQDFTEARREQAENAMFGRVKTGIEKAKNLKELDASAKVLKQNFDDLKAGKVPQLGLSEEQIVELQLLVEETRKTIEGANAGTGAPGENRDAGGEASIQHPDAAPLPLEETTSGVPLL